MMFLMLEKHPRFSAEELRINDTEIKMNSGCEAGTENQIRPSTGHRLPYNFENESTFPTTYIQKSIASTAESRTQLDLSYGFG